MYKEMLIELMERKERRLRKHPSYRKLRKKGIRYFTEKDKQAMMKWDEEKAKGAWSWIEREVAMGTPGLKMETCPFCTYYVEHVYRGLWQLRCRECEYGQNHGRCFNVDSDYAIIKDAVGPDLLHLFPVRWYRLTLTLIKKKFLKGGK